jgi:hypothetical protein
VSEADNTGMSLLFFRQAKGRSGNLERDWNYFVTLSSSNISAVNFVTIQAERLVIAVKKTDLNVRSILLESRLDTFCCN